MDTATSKTTLSEVSCLAAVARFHGLDIPQSQIFTLSGSSTGVVGPRQLASIARKIGLSAKLVRLSWARLGRLGQTLPAILILKNNEAVILSGLRDTEGKEEIVVRDPLAPQAGFQFWDRAKTEENWSGYIVLVKRRFAVSDPQ